MSQFTLNLPDPVLAGTKRLAEKNALTVDEYVSRLLADAVQAEAFWEDRLRRGKQVTRERFLEILRSAPDEEPEPWDRIE